jgi:low affinity Fe/Cu permease
MGGRLCIGFDGRSRSSGRGSPGTPQFEGIAKAPGIGGGCRCHCFMPPGTGWGEVRGERRGDGSGAPHDARWWNQTAPSALLCRQRAVIPRPPHPGRPPSKPRAYLRGFRFDHWGDPHRHGFRRLAAPLEPKFRLRLTYFMKRLFADLATAVAYQSGRAATFLIAVTTIIVWAITGPVFHYSDSWQLIINTGTTIVTFLMVFVIQNTQNRDGAAIQAKLDELIRVSRARNSLIGIEALTQEEIEEIRAAGASRVQGSAAQELKRRTGRKAKARGSDTALS